MTAQQGDAESDLTGVDSTISWQQALGYEIDGLDGTAHHRIATRVPSFLPRPPATSPCIPHNLCHSPCVSKTQDISTTQCVLRTQIASATQLLAKTLINISVSANETISGQVAHADILLHVGVTPYRHNISWQKSLHLRLLELTTLGASSCDRCPPVPRPQPHLHPQRCRPRHGARPRQHRRQWGQRAGPWPSCRECTESCAAGRGRRQRGQQHVAPREPGIANNRRSPHSGPAQSQVHVAHDNEPQYIYGSTSVSCCRWQQEVKTKEVKSKGSDKKLKTKTEKNKGFDNKGK